MITSVSPHPNLARTCRHAPQSTTVGTGAPEESKHVIATRTNRRWPATTPAQTAVRSTQLDGDPAGGIGSLVPDRRSEIAQLGLKALLIATLANFLSAAIASLLL